LPSKWQQEGSDKITSAPPMLIQEDAIFGECSTLTRRDNAA
jgi:hypothetical protein